jgi:hypothetical protein
MTNHEQEQALSKPIIPSPNPDPTQQINRQIKPKPHASILADTAQTTPPTYPFPAYAIVKEQNDGTKFPVARSVAD